MSISKTYLLSILSLFFLLSSCATRKDIVYMQNIEQKDAYDSAKKYEVKLQPDDLVNIIVSAENPEITMPFNLPQIQGNYDLNDKQTAIKSYLVDNDGFIEYPVIGKVKLGGLYRSEAIALIRQKVSEYIKNPSINLRILNYKISVLGEVVHPGTYSIQSERITLLEALSLAGDLTIYGKRNNVLVIHEEDGKKTYRRYDLTQAEMLDSQNYYLAQNDVVFVEPNKTRVKNSSVGQNTALMLSGLTVILSMIIVLKS
ncbi:polysaccharide biosynthesis/export family protein [Flavobacterium sp. CYK-55]|uniref:polysaccharide biosynthesis/export family protein n=1 Tax=Flavobacterium sp. CYK-55 TaxID=2835529 RepID=UPI001BCA7754|nr:polysaccharide biosynthesis/export family protein [Flavobacterium sp. CYK-55]MBS7786416.1 polysaccharide biosynthesis/export family protein [Flavobacterium sp. CYK-55]